MAHFIQNREVVKSDIGGYVTYIPTHADNNASHPDCERGTISSFNKATLWVKFKGPGGESVNTRDLIWG